MSLDLIDFGPMHKFVLGEESSTKMNLFTPDLNTAGIIKYLGDYDIFLFFGIWTEYIYSEHLSFEYDVIVPILQFGCIFFALDLASPTEVPLTY